MTTVAGMDDAAIAGVLADSAENGFDGDSVYAGASDFFFQVVFVALQCLSFLVRLLNV